MNRAISRLGKYSRDSNLALNENKTKWMLLSTKQMARVHNLQTASVNISCNGESLERVTRTKLLGVHMQEHLTWNLHINELATSCYGALAVQKKIEHLPLRPQSYGILCLLNCAKLIRFLHLNANLSHIYSNWLIVNYYLFVVSLIHYS